MLHIISQLTSQHGYSFAYMCALGWLTSREGELNLLLNDLHSNEVVFLIESAIVEKNSVPLFRRKPAKEDENEKFKS